MKSNTKIGLIEAASIAAVGAIGAYYFYGSNKAKKHRKDSVVWMKKAEKEIISKAKKLKDEAFNRKNYEDIVDLVAKKYSSLKEVESKDVSQFVSNLNGAWKDLSKKLKKDIIVLK